MQVVLYLPFYGTSKELGPCKIILHKTVQMPCVPRIGESVIVNGDEEIENLCGVGGRKIVDVSWYEDSPNQFELLLDEDICDQGLNFEQTKWFLKHMKAVGWTPDGNEWDA